MYFCVDVQFRTTALAHTTTAMRVGDKRKWQKYASCSSRYLKCKRFFKCIRINGFCAYRRVITAGGPGNKSYAVTDIGRTHSRVKRDDKFAIVPGGEISDFVGAKMYKMYLHMYMRVFTRNYKNVKIFSDHITKCIFKNRKNRTPRSE